ncbi:hypothetical protein [Blastococcus montanus]|uniref:hypothetical protein n=1 Tax=Blastococcus montanus TaxID=3144973 RepID=UPI00320B4884
METFLVVLAVWTAVAIPIAVLVGRAIHLAERRATSSSDSRVWPGMPDEPPDFVVDEIRTGDRPPPPVTQHRPQLPENGVPTIPGIPVARPQVPRARHWPGHHRQSRRRTGTD